MYELLSRLQDDMMSAPLKEPLCQETAIPGSSK
jgi:hypothetical protein